MRRERTKGNTRYILLFLLGMLVFLYPLFSNLYYDYYVLDLQRDDELTFANLELDEDAILDDADLVTIATDPEMTPLLDKNQDYLSTYNESLWNQSLSTVDPFGEGEITEDTVPKVSTDYSSIFAYIDIPKIDQTLPVYLGATDEHLAVGAAVIQGTSLPIGGLNTNSVISGHTGLVQKFFTDLPELAIGDTITITNRWETLHYRVTGNILIWPDQSEYLAVVPGKDMITLLTCYDGTAANDRFLIFAERWYPEGTVQTAGEQIEQTSPESDESETQSAAAAETAEPEEPNSETTADPTDSKTVTDAEFTAQTDRDTSPDTAPSYITTVEVPIKPWYMKLETYTITVAVLLLMALILNVRKRFKEK
jgi:sortase A